MPFQGSPNHWPISPVLMPPTDNGNPQVSAVLHDYSILRIGIDDGADSWPMMAPGVTRGLDSRGGLTPGKSE